VSLLYSQEFGLALLLVAALALAVRGEGRAAATFALCGAVPVGLTFAAFAAHDALFPMLRDLVNYPRYVAAGFAALPFPSLLQALPLGGPGFDLPDQILVRQGYLEPAICVAGLFFALPLDVMDPRRPIASVRAARRTLRENPEQLLLMSLALYGLLSFRTALGRSSIERVLLVEPAPALILLIALKRTLALWVAGWRTIPLAAWRTLALTLLLSLGSFFSTATPWTTAEKNFILFSKFAQGLRLVGDGQVIAVSRWVRDNSAPTDPVFIFPAGAAYYYLTEREQPTRFELAHHMVTQAHRDEALADLKAHPPRWVLNDASAWRIDNVPDEMIFGREMWGWLNSHYVPIGNIGAVTFLAPKGAVVQR
jgi:hypothetical protein